MWVLRAQAEVYPVLPGFNETRLATTHRFVDSHGVIPRLRLYFQIPNDDEVLLLWIEEDLELRGYEHF